VRYSVHEFAELAGVTVKALHHYDRLGLLKPRRTDSGYRIYAESDLERLEQIVALRFLGLPLKEIRILLERDAPRLSEALHAQRTVLEEKRRHLDTAISAIAGAEAALESGKPAGTAVLKKIIEAIQMQNEKLDATEFMKNYYRGEAWVHFQARHRDWPSRVWSDLFGDIASALADVLTDDPASPGAQALAERWRKLRLRDSGGDPQVHGGLLKAWNDRAYWPETVQNRFAAFPLDDISRFIAGAFAAGRKQRFGDIIWVPELDGFTAEEKSRVTLATVDLYFKIDEVCDQDPADETAQALAARWLELIESRTGSRAGTREDYESYLRWMDSWPSAIHQKIRALNMERINEFILRALARCGT
jgi:DNA-binding transcriptional MerR regulator